MTATLKLKLDRNPIPKLVEQAPSAAYAGLREFIWQCWHDHRMTWLKKKPQSFARGRKGIRVYRVAQRGKRLHRSVHYEVHYPRQLRSPSAARKGLAMLDKAEIRNDSLILKHHEQGGTMRARGRFMTIPLRVKGRIGLEDFKEKYPKRAKRLKRIKRGSEVFIMEEQGKRKRKLKLLYRQTPRVRNKPTLEFYDTWQQLTSKRGQRWQDASDMIVRLFNEQVNKKAGGRRG